jgi:hypothetical protein
MELLSRLSDRAFHSLGCVRSCTVGGRALSVGLLFLIFSSWCNFLALIIVNVAANFKIEIGFGCGSSGGSPVSGRVGLSGFDNMLGTRLEGLKTSGCIGDHAEMSSEGRTNVRWPCLRVNLTGDHISFGDKS